MKKKLNYLTYLSVLSVSSLSRYSKERQESNLYLYNKYIRNHPSKNTYKWLKRL
jgi:hypothetical protein